MFDAITSNTESRDWLQLGTPKETPIEIAAAEDPLLPPWLRRPDGSLPRTVADILEAVARHHGLSKNMLRSERRMRQVSYARHEVSYWAARLSTLSLPSIGNHMGGRDHTTVLYGIRSHAERNGLPLIDTMGRMAARFERDRVLAENERRLARQRRAEQMAEARRKRIEEGLKKAAVKEAQAVKDRFLVESCRADAADWCTAQGLIFRRVCVDQFSDAVGARRRMYADLYERGHRPRIIASACGKRSCVVTASLKKSGFDLARIDRGEA